MNIRPTTQKSLYKQKKKKVVKEEPSKEDVLSEIRQEYYADPESKYYKTTQQDRIANKLKYRSVANPVPVDKELSPCKRTQCIEETTDIFCSDFCKMLYTKEHQFVYPVVQDLHKEKKYGVWEVTNDFDVSEWHGFIYVIRHELSDRVYIGKKSFNNNWKTYTSSSKPLNEEMALNGLEHYKFYIVEIYKDEVSLRTRETELLKECVAHNNYTAEGKKVFYNIKFY